jgi:hypothetical protein
MPKIAQFKCEIGQRFGKRIVIEDLGRDKHGAPMVKMQCDCGSISDVSKANLSNGRCLQCFKCSIKANGLGRL